MKPFVTVIVPVRNEEKFIARCLESIMNQDYGRRFFEVVIVDGASTDRTKEFIQIFQKKYDNLILLNNARRFIPVSLNLALQRARGEIIVRVDGHATIAPDYITRCVNVLESTPADCAGGAILSKHENENGSAIALAMSSRFGVGNARFRLSGYEGYVDTLAFGAYKKSVFARIGIFDEEFIRCEDDEFNYRLIKNGGKIYLSPQIKACYFPRADLKRLWQQYFNYGLWKIRVLQRHASVMQLRQFIPPLFVFTLLFLALAGIFAPVARLLLAGVNALYALSALTCATKLWRSAPYCSFPVLLAAFPVLHLSYGVGFLCGFIKFRNKWRESTTEAAIPFHPRPEYSVVSLQK
jgi:glycosyltransferase involved in cell wall biosynthesis